MMLAVRNIESRAPSRTRSNLLPGFHRTIVSGSGWVAVKEPNPVTEIRVYGEL